MLFIIIIFYKDPSMYIYVFGTTPEDRARPSTLFLSFEEHKPKQDLLFIVESESLYMAYKYFVNVASTLRKVILPPLGFQKLWVRKTSTPQRRGP